MASDLFETQFSSSGDESKHQPLAVRMRPKTISELAGQKHLLQNGSPLLQLTNPDSSLIALPPSVILWGPPGTGKTTIASLIALNSKRRFVELSAVTAGVKDVREVIDEARKNLTTSGIETTLFIDEIHRFSKTQQDALLPAVENRTVVLIAATTENPYFSIISPLMSRSLLLTLHSLEESDIVELLRRAISDKRGLNKKVTADEKVIEQIVRFALGDVRKALTILEAAAAATLSQKKRKITLETLEKSVDIAAIRYDRDGDMHYDIASAFIKSMRGSDADAALHYLARMIVAGEDPRFIARRIMIAASEEIAMADPTALQVAVSAAQAVEKIGMPESGLILAQAVVHVATAPKSNAVTVAIGRALSDVQNGLGGPVPLHLRDAHYSSAKKVGHGVDYRYAHDFPNAIAPQQYLPDELQKLNSGSGPSYYEPNERGNEKVISARIAAIKKILNSTNPDSKK